jgi:putative metallohydrolase (TIGR04338 family)
MVPRLPAGQAELYAAEHDTIDRAGLRWRRLPEAQAYVDGLIGSDWFFERWPHFVRGVVERRGAGSSWSTCQALDRGAPDGSPSEGVILVADGALTQAVVLHELAHLLLPPDRGHDAAFVETLLTLVRHEMGFFAFAEYQQALRQSGRR